MLPVLRELPASHSAMDAGQEADSKQSGHPRGRESAQKPTNRAVQDHEEWRGYVISVILGITWRTGGMRKAGSRKTTGRLLQQSTHKPEPSQRPGRRERRRQVRRAVVGQKLHSVSLKHFLPKAGLKRHWLLRGRVQPNPLSLSGRHTQKVQVGPWPIFPIHLHGLWPLSSHTWLLTRGTHASGGDSLWWQVFGGTFSLRRTGVLCDSGVFRL